MAETPDSVQFTVGVRGPDGKWQEIGTVDVPVVVVRRPATTPLVDVPESAVFDPPAKRCAGCRRLLRPTIDSVESTDRGLVHVHCPI